MFARCWLLSISANFDASNAHISSALGSASFPMLKRVLIRNATPSYNAEMFSMTPLALFGVQSMYLARCRIRWADAPVFSALTTVVISNATMSYEPALNDFAQLCKCAPALVRLEFFNVRCINPGINAWWPMYSELVHLRHLRASFLPQNNGIQLALQLACLDAPNLATLYLDADARPLLQMVDHPPSCLKHVKEVRLKLRSSECQLSGFFNLLPAITRLDILHHHKPIFKALAPQDEVARLCPLLHTVSVICGPNLAAGFIFRRLWAGIPLQRVCYTEHVEGVWASWIQGPLANNLIGERWGGYRDEPWSQRNEDFMRALAESLRYSGLSEAYFKRIAEFKASSIPFSFLATEILVEILLLVPWPFHKRPRDYRRTTYLLSTVSRHVRTFLLQYTTIGPGDTTDAVVADSDIIRSCYVERWTTTLHLLSPKLMQCRHFHLHTTRDTRTHIIFEILSKLDGSAISCLYLDVVPASMDDQRSSPLPVLFNGVMPALARIIVREAFVRGLVPITNSVTRLALWADTSHWEPTVRELFDLLRAMPSLVDLSISNIPFYDDPAGYADDHPLDLPALTNLWFCAYDHTSYAAIGFIRMPALRSLNLVVEPEEVQHLQNSWRRLTSDIRRLALDFTATPGVGTFAGLLGCFPKLELLDCRQCLYVGLHINAMVMHWSNLCPVLRDLWLAEELHDRVLKGILEHATHGHFGADLCLVTLRGHDLEGSVTIPYRSKLEGDRLKSKPAGILQFNSYEDRTVILAAVNFEPHT
ncbi:hypothetical protein B0H16DRAFT_1468495 [Mycena metata]|uniref:Uncharacterized protein n=1 Tax=Mycena metata TaxID=1033252 RepID=A0AAD7MTY1_9AGAR|nr:hypothetical protein B0H16DRAFT_1468495 [Mycena metata]